MRPTHLLILSLLAVIPFVTQCGYNSLQAQDEDVKASWSEVQNQYQRRFDLIPNLVETVKGYAKHEKETLTQVVEARAKASKTEVTFDKLSNAEAFKKYQESQQGLTSALSRLLVVAEKYPDLKANANFRDLQAQLEGTENRIAVSRKRYIDTVSDFNKAVRAFPTNLTAKYLLHLNVRETFSVSEDVKASPKVTF